MTGPTTEKLHRDAIGLDTRQPARILDILVRAQIEAAASIEKALPEIADAAKIAADTLRGTGRLAYAAAGSSGLMALSDALELPGTFGIERERILVFLAGGTHSLTDMAGAPEDDAASAARAVEEAGISDRDTLIALSASGTTPYAVTAAETARRRGAHVIGIANNAGAPLFRAADVAIVLRTPPEPLAGSTRMGAGTAQKIALNLLSTLMAVHLGHVHDGHMVNLRADNAKLKDRARRIVAAVSGCGEEAAGRHLDAAGGAVKTAILLAAGAGGCRAAETLLAEAGDRLRPALAALSRTSDPSGVTRAATSGR